MHITEYVSTLTAQTPYDFSQYFYDGWGDEITDCRAEILYWADIDNNTTHHDTLKELDVSSDEAYDYHTTLATIIGWEQPQDWMTEEMKQWCKSQRHSWWWQLCDDAVAQWLSENNVSYDNGSDNDLSLLHELSMFLHHFVNGYAYSHDITYRALDDLSTQRLSTMSTLCAT